jgi:periplasmic protein TonB
MSECKYSNYKEYKYDGKYKAYYENGQVRKEADYKKGEIDGKLLTYWKNGNPKRIDIYENNKLITGKCFDSTNLEIPYYPYEKKPRYPGGENLLAKYIVQEIKYPENCKNNGIQGTVYVSFMVKKEGNISDVKIFKGVNKELDDEALRVASKLTRWVPGIQDGEAVNVKYILPLQFTLQGNK